MVGSLLLTLFVALFSATDPILLLNPSFEDIPGPGRAASGWYHCGTNHESPPDIHPSGAFQITRPAKHGLSYAGMVVRDNGTTEALGQRLAQALRPGRCYAFSLWLARSATYQSVSRVSGKVTQYNKPVKLRIWGSRNTCMRNNLLAESPVIGHEQWKNYTFYLQSAEPVDYLIIEAAFPSDTRTQGYCGNILLDGCSPLLPVACDAKEAELQALAASFPTPRSPAALDALVANLGREIAFSPGSSALESSLYLGPRGNLRQQNIALHRLVHALEPFDQTRLTVVVKTPDSALLDRRVYHLTWQLGLLGLPPERFTVRSWKRRDRKIAWDAVNASADLFFMTESLNE